MQIEPSTGSNFLSIATTVSGVFLVMAVGAFARYMKWFTSEVDRSLAIFTTNVLLPSFFFHRIMTDPKLSPSLSAWTVVVGTSIVGIVTIPLWMVFGAYWLGF